MTEAEARKKSEEKTMKVKELCKELQIRVVAKQMITRQNTIELAVFYIDEENYDIQPEPKVTRAPLPSEAKIKEAIKDAQPPTPQQ